MELSPERAAWWLALATALVLAGAFAWWRGSKLLRRARSRSRMARAQRGELSARALLRSHGFEVLDEQASGAMVLHVDGVASRYGLRADYVVRRRGRTFVAEVKTGARAPSLDHAPTRRQLLEYASAFAVDGVLLVDPEARSVREVCFDQRPQRRWPALALGILLGVALAGVAGAAGSALSREPSITSP